MYFMLCMMFDDLTVFMFNVIVFYFFVFFFKQKTAYEMRISDWSSDVCSSDLMSSVRGDAGHELISTTALRQAGRPRGISRTITSALARWKTQVVLPSGCGIRLSISPS